MDAASKFLRVYANKNRHLFEFSELSLPDVADYENCISRLRDSAPGPDGLPYSAYKSCKVLSAQIFANSNSSFASESEPPGLEQFNKQLVWFAPKGVADADSVAVYRAPNQLRTIFGSNTDSKIFNGTLGYKLTPPHDEAHP